MGLEVTVHEFATWKESPEDIILWNDMFEFVNENNQ
jgi:hypothetical protein